MSFLDKKIPPPLVALIIAWLMWWLAQNTITIEINNTLRHVLVFTFVGLGLVFDFLALATFRIAKTTINPLQPSKASHLVDTGIYRYTRNPMYVGLGCFLTGWACYLSAPVSIAGIVALVIYLNRFQIQPEEQALSTIFGDNYAAYKLQVRRWL